jgi:hypothetical protein
MTRLTGIDSVSKDDLAQSPTSRRGLLPKRWADPPQQATPGRSHNIARCALLTEHSAMPRRTHSSATFADCRPNPTHNDWMRPAIGPWHRVALMSPSSAWCRGLARYQQYLGPRCLPASARASNTGTQLLSCWFETRRTSKRHVQPRPAWPHCWRACSRCQHRSDSDGV